MQIQRVLFSLMLAFLVCATSVAQDERTETVNPKAAKAKAKAIKTLTTSMLKNFAAANLTDEQQEKVAEIVEQNIASVQEAKNAQDGLLTNEQKQARKDALAKGKEDGLKGQKLHVAADAALGLSKEELAEYNTAKKKLSAAQNKIREAITELLTDEQKAALPKKGKGGDKKKKGEGKKKKPEEGDTSATSNGKTQYVSLSLPGMTCGGCAATVRRALETLDGIADIETDPQDNSCSFSAPADLDVESALNKFAEEGNQHIKGWSLAAE